MECVQCERLIAKAIRAARSYHSLAADLECAYLSQDSEIAQPLSASLEKATERLGVFGRPDRRGAPEGRSFHNVHDNLAAGEIEIEIATVWPIVRATNRPSAVGRRGVRLSGADQQLDWNRDRSFGPGGSGCQSQAAQQGDYGGALRAHQYRRHI